MEIKELAKQALDTIRDLPYGIARTHGFEVAPGFFTLYNDVTGQCKTVLLHLESGFVFKHSFDEVAKKKNSGRYVGEVTFDNKTYPVRLPEFYAFEIDGDSIVAQEYVIGEACECEGGTCEHSAMVRKATRCSDAHRGNWKITTEGEIVLFDFEGIIL